jgi:hypothetical protein
MRRDAVKCLVRTRIDALGSAERGDWMTRLSSDAYNTEEFMTASLPDQISNLTIVIGSASLFCYYTGPIAFILLGAALFPSWFNIVVQRKMGPVLGHARQLEGGVFQSMIESVEGLETIRIYGGQEYSSRKIGKQLDEVYSTGMKITEISANLKADRPVANNGDEIRINAGGFILVTARMLPGMQRLPQTNHERIRQCEEGAPEQSRHHIPSRYHFQRPSNPSSPSAQRKRPRSPSPSWRRTLHRSCLIRFSSNLVRHVNAALSNRGSQAVVNE